MSSRWCAQCGNAFEDSSQSAWCPEHRNEHVDRGYTHKDVVELVETAKTIWRDLEDFDIALKPFEGV